MSTLPYPTPPMHSKEAEWGDITFDEPVTKPVREMKIEKAPDSGIFMNCYICDSYREDSEFSSGLIRRKTMTPTGSYVISYCEDCVNRFLT